MTVQFLVVCLLLNSVGAFQDAPAYQIMKKLFPNDTYKISRNVLPSGQPNNTPVVVTLRLTLHQILDLDEKNEIIKLNFWLTATWNNPYLKWDADKYGGFKTMIIETTKIWTPDITLWNRAVEQENVYERMEKRIRINNDGDCRWKSLITTTSSCTIAVRNFPFDEQNCELQFGSWHYPSNEVEFRLENDTDLTYFNVNREWKLTDTSSEVKRESFKQNGYFDVIHCNFTVHRNAMFYIVNMILPCAVICFLGCLAFLLPPSNGERVSIVVTVLLSINVYMLIVADFMPAAANEIPLVDKFFMVCIFETSLCLIGTCFVVRWNDATGPMPWWIYLIFNCVMPKILFVKHERNVCEVSENTQINQTDTPVNSFEAALTTTTSKAKENRQEDWPLAAKTLNKFLFFFFTILFLVTGILIINQL